MTVKSFNILKHCSDVFHFQFKLIRRYSHTINLFALFTLDVYRVARYCLSLHLLILHFIKIQTNDAISCKALSMGIICAWCDTLHIHISIYEIH